MLERLRDKFLTNLEVNFFLDLAKFATFSFYIVLKNENNYYIVITFYFAALVQRSVRAIMFLFSNLNTRKHKCKKLLTQR